MAGYSIGQPAAGHDHDCRRVTFVRTTGNMSCLPGSIAPRIVADSFALLCNLAGDQRELLRAVRIDDHVHRTRLIISNPLYGLFTSDQRELISPYNC